MKLYPYEKGGTEKVLAMLKGGGGGGTKSVYAVARRFNHIERVRKKFPLFKRGDAKSFTLSYWGGGGGAKKVRIRNFPFCSPTPPPPSPLLMTSP